MLDTYEYITTRGKKVFGGLLPENMWSDQESKYSPKEKTTRGNWWPGFQIVTHGFKTHNVRKRKLRPTAVVNEPNNPDNDMPIPAIAETPAIAKKMTREEQVEAAIACFVREYGSKQVVRVDEKILFEMMKKEEFFPIQVNTIEFARTVGVCEKRAKEIFNRWSEMSIMYRTSSVKMVVKEGWFTPYGKRVEFYVEPGVILPTMEETISADL